MKKIALALLLVVSSLAIAQEKPNNDYSGTGQKTENSIQVEQTQFGSGVPTVNAPTSTSNATLVTDGLYHVPSYLPGFPTAGRIDPRVINVPCRQAKGGKVECRGFDVNVETTGRGEYLYIRPIIVPDIPINEPAKK